MPISEVIDSHHIARREGWTDLGARVFWTDDNLNYAGLYLTGPLAGRVCFIDHEEVDVSPVYRTIRTFLSAVLAAAEHGLGWHEMPTDYPELRPAEDAAATARDWAAVQALRGSWPTLVDARRRHAFAILALTPFDQTATLLTFLRDEDMWVQERCCDVLGRRRHEPAVAQLAEVALYGQHNGRLAAVNALGAIGSATSLTHLLRLAAAMPPGHDPYLAHALQRCGCEIRRDRGRWHYRLPGQESWHPL